MSSHAQPDLAAIAARYGAVIPPGLSVTHIPRGVSARSTPVWNGTRLEYPAQDTGWMADARRRKAAKASMDARPHVVAARARRVEVARLHATGATDDAMAEALGVALHIIISDRGALHLPAHNRAVLRVAGQIDQLRALVADGHGMQGACDLMGLSARKIRDLAARGDVALRDDRVKRLRGPGKPRAAKPQQNLARVNSAKASATATRRAAFAELFATGLDCVQIAARLGITTTLARADRRKLGLPPNAGDMALRAAALKAAKASFLQNCQDRAAAKAARVDQGVDLRGLNSTDVARAARRAANAENTARVLALHNAGSTVEQIAAAMGWTDESVKRHLRASRVTPLTDVALARTTKAADLRQRIAAGASVAEISAAWGCTVKAVYDFAQGQKVRFLVDGKRSFNHGAVSPAVAARRARVAQLRAEGWTLARMAADAGVSMNTICLDIQALGIAGTSAYATRRKAKGGAA